MIKSLSYTVNGKLALSGNKILESQLIVEPYFVTGFTESTIWTCPEGLTTIVVHCIGGGGAGGGAPILFNSIGGGGAGGSYAMKIVTVIPNNEYIINVGLGGIPSEDGYDGGDGGDSWFESQSLVLAKGGGGGTSGTEVSHLGLGGIEKLNECVGDIVYGGSRGEDAGVIGISHYSGRGGGAAGTTGGHDQTTFINNNMLGIPEYGGDGGFYVQLSSPSSASQNGNPGNLFGGGGSGGGKRNGSEDLVFGGNGTQGYVVIEYY